MIRNERLKLATGFVNAIGLGLIGIAVLRPILEIGSDGYIGVVLWGLTGLTFHAGGHYILIYMR